MAKKILVADDEADILKSVSFRLKKAGYEVLTAENGGTAIEMVKNQKPDLVLLDLRMPVKDGFEVCKEIKTDDNLKDIPVIFLTASSGMKVEERLKDYNADGIILKPFDAAELLEKIKSLIG